MPALGFLPASDERVQGTIRAIEKNLMQDGFVLRYKPEQTGDGLAGSEGAFLACSFWLVDAYAYSGRHKDAEGLFERLVSLRNDLGLLSEEYEPKRGRLIGNFPQAFSHLALIHSASVLADAEVAPRAGINGQPHAAAMPAGGVRRRGAKAQSGKTARTRPRLARARLTRSGLIDGPIWRSWARALAVMMHADTGLRSWPGLVCRSPRGTGQS